MSGITNNPSVKHFAPLGRMEAADPRAARGKPDGARVDRPRYPRPAVDTARAHRPLAERRISSGTPKTVDVKVTQAASRLTEACAGDSMTSILFSGNASIT